MKKMMIYAVFFLLLFLSGCDINQDQTFVIRYFDSEGELMIEHESKTPIPSMFEFEVPWAKKEGYRFDGWSYLSNEETNTIDATPNFSILTYMVTFYDSFGEVISSQEVEHLESAIAPTPPEYEGYVFVEWLNEFENVTFNIDVYAKYDPKFYTVTFIDHDGSVLEVQQIQHNNMVIGPIPPSSKVGYQFSHWDQTIFELKHDVTIEAVYTKLYYQVTFLGHNDKILKQEMIGYGEQATPPTNTAQSGYLFRNWNTDDFTITNHTIFRAIYDKQTYTITFINEDKSFIEEITAEHGSSIEGPILEHKEHYYFTGWDQSLEYITQDLTVKAVYEPKVYTVIFQNHLGRDIKIEGVEYSLSAIPPTPPSRTGFRFKEWSEDYTYISKDMIIYPIYEEITFVVTYLDEDDTVLKIETVPFRGQSTPPIPPQKTGKIFHAWDKGYYDVQSDLVLKAIYYIPNFQVTFKYSHGDVISNQVVAYGEDATPPQVMDMYGYEFIGWDYEYTNITSSLIITAQYERIRYTITYLDKDGAIFEIQSVPHGSSLTHPTPQEYEGYTFLYWDYSTNNITENKTISPIYQIHHFYVEFYDAFNEYYHGVSVQYGGEAVITDLPTKTGYTFVRWTVSLENIKQNIKAYPIFEINTYIVTFVDYDGSILKQDLVTYLSEATAPENPNNLAHHYFTGWNQSYDSITSDIIVQAIYHINQYNVTFKQDNGEVLSTHLVDHGTSITPSTPTKIGHTFSHWSIEPNNIISDLTIFANYTVNYYTIKFLDYDGSILLEDRVPYATNLELTPSPMLREYHTFQHWNHDTTFVEDDTIFEPIYLGDFEYEIMDDIITITNINKIESVIEIPQSIEGRLVKHIGDYAFANQLLITSIILHDQIVSIGDYAFYQSSNIESISIPSSTTSIGEYAFYGLIHINQLIIPDSIEEIGYGAFGLTSVTSIELPDSYVGNTSGILFHMNQIASLTVPSIDWGIWGYFNGPAPVSLTHITITAQTYLNRYSFSSENYITHLVISNQLEEFSESSLSGLTYLEELTIPFVGLRRDNITSWYEGKLSTLFGIEGNKSVPLSLKKIQLTDTEIIPELAFSSLSQLEEVILPSNLKRIEREAFSGSGLLTIELPYGLEEIGLNAYAIINPVPYVFIPETVIELGYINSQMLYYQKPYDGEVSAYLSSNAAYNVNQIITTELYEYAITNNLDEVIIGKYFGNQICIDINVAFPYHKVIGISRAVFRNMSQITTIHFGNHLEYISSYTFENLTNLTTLVFPDTLKEIGNYAFNNATSLINISFSQSLTYIGMYAFQNATSITSLAFPSSLEYIGSNAFSGSINVESIVFGENSQLRTIDTRAFEHMNKVTTLTIPDSVSFIGYASLKGMSSLETLIVPYVGMRENYAPFGSIFGRESYEGTIGLVQVTGFQVSGVHYIPITLKTIVITRQLALYDYALHNLSSIDSLYLPSALTSISEYALYNASNFTIYTELDYIPSDWPMITIPIITNTSY